jgi:oligoribonuclease
MIEQGESCGGELASDECAFHSRREGCATHGFQITERPKFYLAFLDFETTGLRPRENAEPIEVAVLVTDDRLNELGRFESLLIPLRNPGMWDPICVAMHGKSGLLDLCLEEGVDRDIVAAALLTWLTATVPAGAQLHLAGNSVHFDRGFLAVYFPELERRFHHRHLDVSSIRIAASVFAPDAAPVSGTASHRAMDDVVRSIAELRYWREVLRG